MKTFKLGRIRDNRTMLRRNLATSLLLFERITTTRAKAKMTKAYLDKMLAKIYKTTDKLILKRYLLKELLDKKAIDKIFEVYLPKMKKMSGLIKSYNLANRSGDNATQVILKLDPALTQVEQKQEKQIVNKKDDKSENDKNIQTV
ncbi:MAG: large subunit ribosomal protein L17 [Candidatus Berkelbacteria bacterium Licking1014_85]|uniref:50S ribosomal protein L17 n=1 Tax=Candidatus Berkelbacteria bacterium Licking1014_85 TaxID=2017148 RepID=A0A554LLU3_9BACT|nr:MAG: large subunit ribosomal protein L17 [Candidatus Berkelbacteria bacterium Licking1014_85]